MLLHSRCQLLIKEVDQGLDVVEVILDQTGQKEEIVLIRCQPDKAETTIEILPASQLLLVHHSTANFSFQCALV